MNPDSRINVRLLKGVAAKLFVDLIVVCVIVSLTAFSQSSPLVRGRVDVADGQRVAGWVYDPRSPDEGIEVQLFVDGRFGNHPNGHRHDYPSPAPPKQALGPEIGL